MHNNKNHHYRRRSPPVIHGISAGICYYRRKSAGKVPPLINGRYYHHYRPFDTTRRYCTITGGLIEAGVRRCCATLTPFDRIITGGFIMRTHIFPFLNILLPLSFSFILSTFHLSLVASSSSNLIQGTCKKCSDTDPNLSYNFCTVSFESSPDGRRCADLRDLGLVSIRLTKNNVTSTRHFIKHLLHNDNNKKKLDPYVKACLRDCMELFNDAVLTIKVAVKDYKAKRYDDANIGLSSVIDASSTCEDGFKETDETKKHVVSPLSKRMAGQGLQAEAEGWAGVTPE
ncbi:putative invertase inhibitor [Humulus lupulus]|uniref:putative invertase inhibitor n=2 Tax=Humulus lupulus TaxID=3486 RepID=UPI002B411DD3|nr:putative invertase inhibitor [Humulus lupulus]